MPKSIIIVGAGISGLAAACYGRLNGFDTLLLEQHDKPGGLCTSWKRHGYTIDGCLHWLVGSGPGNELYRTWEELGAVQGVEMIDHEEFLRVEGREGKVLSIYTNIDRFERHLLQLSPGDAAQIRKLTRLARKFATIEQANAKAGQGFLPRILKKARTARYLLLLITNLGTSVQSFCKSIEDRFVREALLAAFDMPDFPLLAFALTLAWMNNKTAGYPVGGSLEFARRIERRYLSLGGKVRYEARVKKILVQDGRACGVQLDTGERLASDFVISAADGHSTLYEMLGEQYLDSRIVRCFEKLEPFPPLIYIGVGVNRDFSTEPASVICLADPPLEFAGRKYPRVYLRHYCYDPTLAPKGKSVLTTMMPTDYDWWKEAAKDQGRYQAEKCLIGQKFVEFLESRFPGIGSQVEMVDVATPMTFERYTLNWRGSFEGWLITTRSIKMRIPRTLRKVSNFYLIGQWVQPGGGVPTGAMHGKEVIRRIMKASR